MNSFDLHPASQAISALNFFQPSQSHRGFTVSLWQRYFVGELALSLAISVFFKAKNIWVFLFLFTLSLTPKNSA